MSDSLDPAVVTVPKTLLSGTAAAVVGAIGLALAAASALLPPPYGVIAGIVGFLAAGLAGLAAPSPKVAEGKPVLQGTALTVAVSVGGLLAQFYPMIPAGWPQSLALSLAALLAWLTGHALPQLGSPSTATLQAAVKAGDGAAELVSSKSDAVSTLAKGPEAP